LNEKKINIGYCGLALGITGAFNILKYMGLGNSFLEVVFIGTPLFLLVYFAGEFLKNKRSFMVDMRSSKNLSLLPTFFMASANIVAHMELETVWLLIVAAHLLYGMFFYRKVLFKGSPLVSYYIPLAGIAVNIPHAHLFQVDIIGKFLLVYGGVGYLVVSWRLLLHWRSFMRVNPLPLLGILCAPLSLLIQGQLIYFHSPHLVQGALIVSLITTFAVYLIIPVVLMSPFTLGWASLTFPTSAAAMGHLKGGIFLESSKLTALGYCEVFFSFLILLVVCMGVLREVFNGDTRKKSMKAGNSSG